jgi:LemA protein
MTAIVILAVAALIAGFVALLASNDLIQLLVRSESALLNIEVLLKVRHDLVPNLVDTVKSHAGN